MKNIIKIRSFISEMFASLVVNKAGRLKEKIKPVENEQLFDHLFIN